ncbi:MAG TPA: hypothetical protein VJJ82_03500 [Candidatus Nanoarchaeia archaeon]|nr:hypothetical protein [Candidatus Nanoarchaeia archaeon]
MNKTVLFLIMIAMLAIGVNAIQVDTLAFGGASQERNADASITFRITNNNTATLNNIALSLGSGANDAKYHINFSGAPTSLTAGQSVTVIATAHVPLDHPGVDANLKENPVKIGTLTVTGNSGTVETTVTDVTMQAINQLKIKKVRIECDTKSQSLSDGDKIKNLKPGDDCSMEVQVENNFNNNDRDARLIGDIEFQTIDVNLDSSSSDVDFDDDSDNLDNLAAGDDDSLTFSLQIDEEAADRTSTIIITVNGRDDNSAIHGEKRTVRLEVVRLTHDIQIRRVELAPSRVLACEATSVKATVNILNQGKRDEDKVAVEVSVPDLKFSKKVTDLSLDKDDSTVTNLDIPVPKNTKQGVMRVDVRTFFDTIAQSNSGSVDLTVDACDTATANTSTGTSGTSAQTTTPQTTVTTPTTTTIVPTTTGVPATRKTTSIMDSPVYIAILAVGIVIAVVVLVVLLVALLRRRKE